MAGIGAIIGFLVGSGLDLSFVPIISLAFLTVVFVTAAGNAMNDYFDRDVDAISHKKRPIPSGRLFPKEVIIFAAVCFATGIFLAIFINPACLVIAVFNILLLISYDKRLKQTGFSGNIAISYLVASTFLFGGAAAGNIALAGILVLLAFLTNLGREVIKDIEDIAGDRGKRETLPMKIGEKKTVIIANFCIGGAILLSPLPWIWNMLGQGYLAVIIADLILMTSIFVSFRNVQTTQKLIKVGMLLALLSFLLGGIT